MARLARMLLAAGVVGLFFSGARGELYNGDFSSGLDSWDVSLVVDESYPGYGIAEVTAEQLHLKAVNNYLWDEPSADWLMQESDLTWMTVSQLGTVPAGASGFYFDGLATITGGPASEELTAEAYVQVTLFYNDFAASRSWKLYASQPWTSFGEALPDLAPGSMFDVIISAQSGLDYDYAEAGHDYHISVESTLDNVSFVPEPASMALALLGGLAVLRRRR